MARKQQSSKPQAIYKVTDNSADPPFTFAGNEDEVKLYGILVWNISEAKILVNKLERLTHVHDTLYHNGLLRVEYIGDQEDTNND